MRLARWGATEGARLRQESRHCEQRSLPLEQPAFRVPVGSERELSAVVLREWSVWSGMVGTGLVLEFVVLGIHVSAGKRFFL
jgi:hypothetical protein